MVLPACRKDHPVGVEDLFSDCIPTPAAPLQDWNYQLPQHFLGAAKFNPHNGNEIMFFVLNHGLMSDFRLYRYALGTNSLTEVLAGNNLVNMGYSWGTNGYILLTMYAQNGSKNIFMCSDDGDSLHQLTFTDWNFGPMWSPDATRWAFYNNSVGLSVSMVCSSDSASCDELGRAIGDISCWYSANSVVTILSMTSTFSLFSWTISSDGLHMVQDIPYHPDNMGGPKGLTVLADGRTALWLQTTGLYKSDLISGATERVSGGTCNSRYFVGLDYSPHTNKLLTTRITRTPAGDHDLVIETAIVLMNPDGTGLEVLDIPFPE